MGKEVDIKPPSKRPKLLANSQPLVIRESDLIVEEKEGAIAKNQIVTSN